MTLPPLASVAIVTTVLGALGWLAAAFGSRKVALALTGPCVATWLACGPVIVLPAARHDGPAAACLLAAVSTLAHAPGLIGAAVALRLKP